MPVRARGRVVQVERLDGVAVGLQGRDVLVEIPRRRRVGRLVRRQPGVVLGGHDEHPLGGARRARGDHAVGEALLLGARDHADVDHVTGDQRPRRLRRPGLDEIGRNRRPHALVVLAAQVAEALAAAPRRGGQRDRATAAAGARDRQDEVDLAEDPARRGLEHLSRAVGDVEPVGLDVRRGLDLVLRRVIRGVARAVGTVAIERRRRHVAGEVEVLLEDRLDLALVVGEREAGAAAAERAAGRRLALVEFRRPRHRPVLVVRVVGRLAVGDVEVRRPLRDVRVDRRVAVRARDRLEPGVVVGVDVGDVAERVQQQLRRRVVVDDRLGRDLPQEPVVREVLGLRQRVRAAVGAARSARARTLVVETPRGRVVAVRVDAVLAVAEDPVAVVVAHASCATGGSWACAARGWAARCSARGRCRRRSCTRRCRAAGRSGRSRASHRTSR